METTLSPRGTAALGVATPSVTAPATAKTTTGNSAAATIAILLPALAGGGAERVMLHLSSEFLQRGVAVDLLVRRAEGAWLKSVPTGVRLIDLKAATQGACIAPLARYLREQAPDVLMTATSEETLTAMVARAKVRGGRKTRIVPTLHTTPSVEWGAAKRGRARLRAWAVAQGVRYLFPRTDGIISVSEGAADDLVKSVNVRPECVQVIYNPNIFPGLREMAAAPSEHPWFSPDCPSTILSVGRLVQQKDFGLLLRAFAKLKQQRQDARLVILGEGPERSSLESLVQELGIAESVSLPGFVSNPFACMSRAAVYALSSRWEGLPSVLVEALACGAPVVSTDCPSGPRELLKGGRYGVLTPVGDIDALAKALQQALDGNAPRVEAETLKPFESAFSAEAYLRALFGGLPGESTFQRTGSRRHA